MFSTCYRYCLLCVTILFVTNQLDIFYASEFLQDKVLLDLSVIAFNFRHTKEAAVVFGMCTHYRQIVLRGYEHH